MFNYIIVNGYYATGASAVVDYLKEFRETFTPDCEFRIVKEHHGIIDLDYVLNGQNDSLDEDSAFRDFIELTKKYIRNGRGLRPFGLGYENYFGKNFQKLTDNYVEELTDYHFNGYWWYVDMYDEYPLYIKNKILRRLGIDDRLKKKMRFRYKDEASFLQITRNYLNSVFEDLLQGQNVENVVLEQVVPANKSGLAYRYFPDCKVVTVERDPRAVFAESAITYRKQYDGQLGPYALDNGDIDMFIQYYLKMRRKSKDDGEHLSIQFEDFVLDKNEAREKLLAYLDISASDHINKEKFFVPEESKKNIRAWKKYDIEKEIKYIEEQLPEYIYQE